MNSKEYQDAFCQYLLQRMVKHNIPNLKKYADREQEARLSIYRNNVFSSLIEVLASTFPAVKSVIGNTLFRHAGAAFISEHPPTSAAMLDYGKDFPEFIRAYPHTQQLDYLGDLARLELAHHQAYYAEDTPPLTAEQFSHIDIETLSNSAVECHPSCALVESSSAIYSVWEYATQHDCALAASQTQIPEHVLITRPEYSVNCYLLTPIQSCFISLILHRHTIGEALEQTMHWGEQTGNEFLAPETIQLLIESQISTKLITKE